MSEEDDLRDERDALVAALHLYVDEDECVCEDPDFEGRVKCVACVGQAALNWGAADTSS